MRLEEHNGPAERGVGCQISRRWLRHGGKGNTTVIEPKGGGKDDRVAALDIARECCGVAFVVAINLAYQPVRGGDRQHASGQLSVLLQAVAAAFRALAQRMPWARSRAQVPAEHEWPRARAAEQLPGEGQCRHRIVGRGPAGSTWCLLAGLGHVARSLHVAVSDRHCRCLRPGWLTIRPELCFSSVRFWTSLAARWR